jgi:hypothetical protein
MGLFSRHKHQHIIQDPVFGPLRQRNDDSNTRFEGECSFNIGNSGEASKVACVIYADKDGPTEAQRDFYQHLQNNFDTCVAKMIPLVEKELKLWGKEITIKDFKKEFPLAAITISSSYELPLAWEAILNTIHDTNHQLIVDFLGDEPVDILIDV